MMHTTPFLRRVKRPQRSDVQSTPRATSVSHRSPDYLARNLWIMKEKLGAERDRSVYVRQAFRRLMKRETVATGFDATNWNSGILVNVVNSTL